MDINNASNKTTLDSADLGKNSLLQSVAINKTGDTIGLSTFDGRSNISNIVKSTTGQYSQVDFILYFRKLSLLSNRIRLKKTPVTSFFIPLMLFHSHQSVTFGL